MSQQLHSEKSAASTVRVVSQNLFGRRAEWQRRREVLRTHLKELEPDIVAFQESIVTKIYDQVADLLDSAYTIIHQSSRELGAEPDVEPGQGFSIASRWPVTRVHELDLHLTPRTTDFACGALLAEIQVPEPTGSLLLVFHNPSWKLQLEYERELQAVATARFIENIAVSRDVHVVIVGDLDADPMATSTRFWTGRHALDGMSVCYRDVWECMQPDDPGHTFTPSNPLLHNRDWPFRRIDYLLVRCNEHDGPTLDIESCELIFHTAIDGVWGSDHFGLVADLSVLVSPWTAESQRSGTK